jgi:hypothetical protein
MAATAGVYLAFDEKPGVSDSTGRGIGPYDRVVLRGARAVGERDGLGKIIALRGSAGSWRDAESPSSGSDEVEPGCGALRISAGSGEVLVRFSDDEVTRHAPVSDLGPFASVAVGTHEVRGDEDTLAVRVSRISPWQLTDRAGPSFQGTTKDALIFVVAAATSQPRRVEWAQNTWPSEPAAPASKEDPGPAVWVDRVKPAPNIYISRPDRKS